MGEMNTLYKILLLQSALYYRSRENDVTIDKLSVFELLKTVQKWALFNKSMHMDEINAKQFIEEENLLEATVDTLKKKIESIVVNFKKEWIGEIKNLEAKWVDFKNEIKDIETGKLNNETLISEHDKANGKFAEEYNTKDNENTHGDVTEAGKEAETEFNDTAEDEKAEDESAKNIHKRTRSKAKLDTDVEEIGEEPNEALPDPANEERKSKKRKVADEAPTIREDKRLEQEVTKDSSDEKEEEQEKELVDVINEDAPQLKVTEIDVDHNPKEKDEFQNAEEEADLVKPPTGNEKPMPSSKTLQHLFIQILSQLESHRFSSMFLNPVSGSDEPEYFNLILQPIDLKTIHRKVRAGEIDSLEKLERDINLMLANAVMYNDMNEERVSTAIKEVETQWIDLRNILKESIYG